MVDRTDANRYIFDLDAALAGELVQAARDTAKLDVPRDGQWATKLDHVCKLAPFLKVTLVRELDMPGQVVRDVNDASSILLDALRGVGGSNPKSPEDVGQHFQKFGGQVERIRVAVAPYFGADPEQVAELASALESWRRLRQAVAGLEKRAQAALDLAQRAADKRVAEGLIADFAEKAKEHRGAARVWLGGMGAVALAILTVGLTLLSGGKVLGLQVPPIDPEAHLGEAFAANSVRLAVLGALAYGLVFSARNYRANKHAQVSYEMRGSVVQTAVALAESSSGEAERAVIISAMVNNVFTTGDTGFGTRGGIADGASPTAAIAPYFLGDRRDRQP